MDEKKKKKANSPHVTTLLNFINTKGAEFTNLLSAHVGRYILREKFFYVTSNFE